jgi:hypothetical protein
MSNPATASYVIEVQENALVRVRFLVFPTTGPKSQEIEMLLHFDQAAKLASELGSAVAEAQRRLGMPRGRSVTTHSCPKGGPRTTLVEEFTSEHVFRGRCELCGLVVEMDATGGKDRPVGGPDGAR